jgi:hypothetical protein
LFPASIGKTGKLSRRPLVRTDAADMLKRRLKQAGLRIALFASLIPGDRHHEFSVKMTEPLKPLSDSPATPTAGRQNSMTVVARRFYSKTWSKFVISFELRRDGTKCHETKFSSVTAMKIQNDVKSSRNT